MLFVVSVIEGATTETIEALQNFPKHTSNPIALLLTHCSANFDTELIQILIAEMKEILQHHNLTNTTQIPVFRDDDIDLKQKVEYLYFFKKNKT